MAENKSEIGKIVNQEITEEVKDSYLAYAMSVIISRALPDARDGLKPVHRRILYAMWEDGLRASAKYRKSASVIGNVLKSYHPHGDASVYDALVRMAQDFSLRYPLIDGQGNFGCFTKDTKVKLVDGRDLSFEELTKEYNAGKKNYTYTFNSKAQKIGIAEIKNPRVTKKNAEIVKVVLDNGTEIKCTPDHLFMLRNGSYKKAKDLQSKDSLMPAYFNIKRIRSHYNYLAVLQPLTGYYEFVHRLADEYNIRKNKKLVSGNKTYVLHHKDFNKFNNSPDNIERVSAKQHYRIHLEQARNLWKEKGDEFREKHRQALIKHFSDPVVRKEISVRTKILWENPNYRLKYAKNHFQKMADAFWANPGAKEYHRQKIARQRQSEEFRKKHSTAVQISNRRRLKENPKMIEEMTNKAKIALHNNWQNHFYKEKIIKNKILGYVNLLLRKYKKVNFEIYENQRTNNGVPKIENALKYFDNFSEIVERSRTYNHKVIKIEYLQKKEDVYDLTVDGTHNFCLAAGIFVHNSVDGDSAAAYRYTEARLSKIAEEILADIEKNTVDFRDNYDGSTQEPKVLPTKIPQLLLNGTDGIAVGMATKIPPHNLSELMDALAFLIDEPKCDNDDLLKFVQGPDFPTGGIIYNQKDIIHAYSSGRGPMVVRAKTDIAEMKNGQFQIVISEIPFQVNKSALIENMAELVTEKRVEGIKDIRDESDKDGLRIVIDLKNDSYPQKVLNNLFKFTDLQKTYHLNMLALTNEGLQPQILTLKDTLEQFLDHRKIVIVRRTKFDSNKAKERAHILEGLKKALDKIDVVIKTIRAADTKEIAHKNLVAKFKLTPVQVTAILEMKLQTLAGLERKKILEELKEKMALITELEAILKSDKKVEAIVKKEFSDIKAKYGDERRTKIIKSAIGEFKEEDLVPQEEAVMLLTKEGYIKRVSPDAWRTQSRGGKGVVGMATKEEDIVDISLTINTHNWLLFFTNHGKVYQSKGYEIPEGSRTSKGRAIVNFLNLAQGEKVNSILALKEKRGKQETEKFVILSTKNGIIKKVAIEDFGNVRQSGIIAINLKGNDALSWVKTTSGIDEIMLVTKNGIAIRFSEKDVRPMGRGASGVAGIRLKKGDEVAGMDVINKKENERLLVVTENGYGKQTDIKEYKKQKRGGSGIKTANITAKTGAIIDARILSGEETDLIAISERGQVIRTSIKSISVLGRATQGVRIMKLGGQDKVASVTCV